MRANARGEKRCVSGSSTLDVDCVHNLIKLLNSLNRFRSISLSSRKCTDHFLHLVHASVVLTQVLVRSRLVVCRRRRRRGAAGGRADASASRSRGAVLVSYPAVVQRHVVVDDVVRCVRSADRRPTDRLRDVRVVRYDVLQFGHTLAVSTDLWKREMVRR